MRLIIAFLLLPFASFATTYYIDATGGNNTNMGTSAGAAWKTLAKFNSSKFANGDIVLLKRGEVFYGDIICMRPGLTFGAYGEGAKPVITGLSIITGWVDLGGNIWEAPTINVKATVNLVLKDGVMKAVGRTPNTNTANRGYYINTATTLTSINGPALSSFIDWKGAEVVQRINRWDIAKATVLKHAGGVITFASSGYKPRVGYGYFFQRDPRTLDQDGEWWQDGTNNKLRMYFSDNNPTAHIIKAATIDTLFRNIYSFVTVRDIEFNGSGKFGIRNLGGTDIAVRNCDFYNSGDEACYLKSQTVNMLIDSCFSRNSYGSAFRITSSGTGTKNAAVTNCIADSNALFIGMMPSTEEFNPCNTIQCTIGLGDSLRIINNRVTNQGYCGISWTGDGVYVKYNYVDSICSVKDDGGGIYTAETTGSMLPTRTRRYIIGNIVGNGIGAIAGSTGTFQTGVNGLYIDLGTRTVVVDSNTIFNIPGNGIHGNNNQDITITNNTIFNCTRSHSAQRFNDALPVKGMRITHNIFYPYNFQYINARIDNPALVTKEAGISAMGKLDSNYYSLRTGTDSSLRTETYYQDGSHGSTAYYPFDYIKGTIGQETHSVNVPNTGILKYNATNLPVTISLKGYNYTDVYGTNYPGSITLQPWKSAVLLQGKALPGRAGRF